MCICKILALAHQSINLGVSCVLPAHGGLREELDLNQSGHSSEKCRAGALKHLGTLAFGKYNSSPDFVERDSAMQFPLRFRAALSVAFLLLTFCALATNAQVATSSPVTDSKGGPSAGGQVSSSIVIHGPLRSFLRMAGISQQASPEEAMPLFARNIYVQGYVGWRDRSTPTEFLILLGRYANQSKELSELAGASGTIHLGRCEDAAPLLRILGYRMRQQCGNKDAALITADAERAFLTMDSGFPLPALEDSFRHGREFEYHFPETRVPILFSEKDWKNAIHLNKREPQRDVIELFLRHPAVARLYWALSRMDAETRDVLRQKVGLERLVQYSPELDYYGTQITIRSGVVEVPGGAVAEQAWGELVGASPRDPGEFITRLLGKDKGWLATYFDCLERVTPGQQKHFAEAARLKAYYAAFRGPHATGEAARPAFRLAPGLLLLLTRLQWESDDQPLVPGGVDLWKDIFKQKSDHSLVHDLGKISASWNRSDQVLEAMFALSRLEIDSGPLQMYLLFNELDGKRSPNHRLKPETLRLMARHFEEYKDQFEVFSEFAELDDASIVKFIDTASALDRISSHTLRGNALGVFQANIGIWQILARQREIPEGKLNKSWQEGLAGFDKIGSPAQLVDVGCASLRSVFHAVTGKPNVSQDEIIELLAGPRQNDPDGQRVHVEMAKGIRGVMDGQRLVSLDALLALADGLSDKSKGAGTNSLLPMMAELREFQMPRPIFSSSERSEWAAGIYNNRHTEMQMQTDVAKQLKGSPSPAQIEEARGELAPFLRDTLVGLNYAYYEPPGAQLLRVDPLFVRSHDFAGETVEGVEGLWRTPQLFGAGIAAGGGAHLVGSLADLPYALSEAEQDFIVPENVQALIWREAVPGLLASAILPRWWNVSKNELHAITLHQRAGEELLLASESDQALRQKVINILSQRMTARQISWLQQELTSGNAEDVLLQATPADDFYLSVQFRQIFPDDTTSWGPAGKELALLIQEDSAEVNWARLSRDFGVPHPILAQSQAPELISLKPFPAFAGYSSRLMAESWDSNNLYWARLVDEMGLPPAALNRIVPELTREMVGKIFATDFEDWQALLRAMRQTGKEFREGKIAGGPATRAAAGQTVN